MKNDGKTRSFYIPNTTFEKLDKYAKKRDISRSALLRILINEHLKGDVS